MSRIDRLMNAASPWPADAGLETVMVFLEGLELPHFASFFLLDSAEGQAAMTRYFDRFLALAETGGTGFVLDTATWRANMGWAAAMGMDRDAIRNANLRAVDYARDYRAPARNSSAADPDQRGGWSGRRWIPHRSGSDSGRCRGGA